MVQSTLAEMANQAKLLLSKSKKILLVLPPAYDYRLEWAKWHQPTGLLQIAGWLKNQQKDVRLIDCLSYRSRQIPRQKIGSETLEGYTFNKWRFGLPERELKRMLEALVTENWQPDCVLVSTLNSVWWEAARDTIITIREVFPETTVILGGAYPTTHPTHANQHSGAHLIFTGHFSEAFDFYPDLSLYTTPPAQTGIYFYRSVVSSQGVHSLSPRPASEVINEISRKVEMGVREFSFFDTEIRPEDHDIFCVLLDKMAGENPKCRFYLLGNISPGTVTKELAQKIQNAHIREVHFHCNLNFNMDAISYGDQLSEYRHAVNLLHQHGNFRQRTGEIVAMLVVGLPFENLEKVCERVIELAHIIGSVTIVPFQYVPGVHEGALFDRALAQNGHFTPEFYNSKTFPMARLSRKPLEEYLELLRMTTLLNSKYHSVTFDFFDDTFAAGLFRKSITTRAWDPFYEPSEIDDAPSTIPLIVKNDGIL